MQENANNDVELMAANDAPYWMHVNQIKIDGQPFDLEGRKYQQDIMRPITPEGKFKHYEVIRKGAQIGITMCKVSEMSHGAIYGHYPQGIIIYFPSKTAVEQFSVMRFKPFIDDNQESVGKYTKTDRQDFRMIAGTKVCFFGGTATTRVHGDKKDSMSMRSVPADWVLLDERDLFDEEMSIQVDQRLGNSKINRRTDMGTPTIPDYGVDALYKKSDQRRWQVQCESCRKHTCLVSNFPQCIKVKDYEAYFVCSHCGARITPNNGTWEPDNPKSDIVGYWPSRLLNPNVDLMLLLKQYSDPESYSITLAEFKRTTLGEPHIEAEDVLTESDIYACCGRDNMPFKSEIPSAMGVDVHPDMLYAVIGYQLDRDRYKITKCARVLDWGKLHDLARDMRVRWCVIDAMPEKHRAAQFQKDENYGIWLAFTPDNQRQTEVWRTDNIVSANRTELYDATHCLVRNPGQLILPRRDSEELKIYAHQMTRSVRCLMTDLKTGQKVYRYICRGDKEDHYRAATNYFYLACRKGVIPKEVRIQKKTQQQDRSYTMNAKQYSVGARG